MKFKITLLLSLFCVACTTPLLSAAQTVPKKPEIVIAFPKTYNRLETTKLYGPYMTHLAACAKVDLVNLRGENIVQRPDSIDLLTERELLEHLQSGKLQIAQLTSGLVPVAVETNSATPFATRGSASTGKIASYQLKLITRIDSGFTQPTDLIGKRIAHTTPGSNSGNLAPRAYFPKLGLQPDKNYSVLYSQGHERSIMGVLHGFYDGAAIASDQFQRMVTKGEIRASTFRTLWESEPFPAEAFVMGKQTASELAARLRKCTYDYRFHKDAIKLLDGSDRLLPISFEKDYAAVRYVLAQINPK